MFFAHLETWLATKVRICSLLFGDSNSRKAMATTVGEPVEVNYDSPGGFAREGFNRGGSGSWHEGFNGRISNLQRPVVTLRANMFFTALSAAVGFFFCGTLTTGGLFPQMGMANWGQTIHQTGGCTFRVPNRGSAAFSL